MLVTKQTAALWRFELLEILRQPSRWAFWPLGVLLCSGMAVFLGPAAANALAFLPVYTLSLPIRVRKKHALGTLSYAYTRPIGLMRVLIVRLSLLVGIGALGFIAIGVALAQHGAVFDTALKIEQLETLTRLEQARFVTSVFGEEAGERPPAKSYRPHYVGEVHGVWSPALVTLLLAFAAYLSLVLSSLQPVVRTELGGLKDGGRLEIGQLVVGLAIVCFGMGAILDGHVVATVYVHPVLWALAIVCVLTLQLLLAISVWRRANV